MAGARNKADRSVPLDGASRRTYLKQSEPLVLKYYSLIPATRNYLSAEAWRSCGKPVGRLSLPPRLAPSFRNDVASVI